ncbi:hypothetical protein [Spiroplasma poulsonii]|uniref:hypothetical protein n=1 Tax=Spiroplasma poulsonii TaxID=2138 RepID=UPI001F4CD04F|nr:hypothetical protein [Spiroplasma poulsonii]UNF61389.1 hypothetical protein MNU24_05595 [Spiroplasma poulsonii]
MFDKLLLLMPKSSKTKQHTIKHIEQEIKIIARKNIYVCLNKNPNFVSLNIVGIVKNNNNKWH